VDFSTPVIAKGDELLHWWINWFRGLLGLAGGLPGSAGNSQAEFFCTIHYSVCLAGEVGIIKEVRYPVLTTGGNGLL